MNPRLNRPLASAAIAAVALWPASPALAVSHIRVTATEIVATGVRVEQPRVVLSIDSPSRTRLDIDASQVLLPEKFRAQVGEVSALHMHCDDPVIREPRFSCDALLLTATASRLPPLRFAGRTAFDSDTGAVEVHGKGPELASSALALDFSRHGESLAFDIELPDTPLSALLPVFAPWFTSAKKFEMSGSASLKAQLRAVGTQRLALVNAGFRDISFQNVAATWIGEKLDARLQATLDLSSQPLAWQVQVRGDAGQFLGGPVLLDLARNGLDLQARGSFDGQRLQIEQFSSHQEKLARVTGSADLQLFPFQVRAARIVLDELLFPDAYASFLQLALTTTPFNQLQTEGVARGALSIRDNAPVAVGLEVEGLTLRDAKRELEVTGVEADLNWSAGETGPPQPSFLSWDSSRGWGFTGARSCIDFATHDRSFQLLHPARLPLFDGALVIQRLAVEDFGDELMSGEFQADLEPISLAPIAKAMGWPEFAGVLSGHIPGLTYKDKWLRLDGDLEADVFDGHVVASRFSVRDPLGKYPRLYGDIKARNLDLELVTRAFDFGSITGRLDVNVANLETLGWSASAFDLFIRTPANDRSRHRISQRAVQNLSNLGGGGGGVAAALQGPALRLFETFGYDRIGLTCQLRNDVCLMAGVAPAENGYYIVKGSGLPRIDIIGISSRVDWPRFVSQVAAAISNTEGIVVN